MSFEKEMRHLVLSEELSKLPGMKEVYYHRDLEGVDLLNRSDLKWLWNAKKKDAVVAINYFDFDEVTDGLEDPCFVIWDSGTWEGGIWEYGSWRGGTWERGVWKLGRWGDGIWKIGTWLGGTWHGGTWHGGTWYGGIWEGGTWMRGLWIGGKWLGGIWNEDLWASGLDNDKQSTRDSTKTLKEIVNGRPSVVFKSLIDGIVKLKRNFRYTNSSPSSLDQSDVIWGSSTLIILQEITGYTFRNDDLVNSEWEAKALGRSGDDVFFFKNAINCMHQGHYLEKLFKYCNVDVSNLELLPSKNVPGIRSSIVGPFHNWSEVSHVYKEFYRRLVENGL